MYDTVQTNISWNANVPSIVAIHGLYEDELQTWTDPASNYLWLRDLLPQKLRRSRVLTYSYKASSFTSPGAGSTNSTLAHANNLVAELCADRQLCYAFSRPIIFICHGFGGVLLKRALAYSSSRDAKAVAHLRSIYTCTYGILFLGTPHNGMTKEALLLQSAPKRGPSHFMLSLLKGSEMLNEINDQFAPLMKHFSVFNFWEELETEQGTQRFFLVEQESAAPSAWDNVERCGITATHSMMTKLSGHSDRRFQPILEALSRYTNCAPTLIESRWKMNAQLMGQRRQHEVEELLGPPPFPLTQSDPTPPEYNQWSLIPRKPSTYFTGRQKYTEKAKNLLGPVRKHGDHNRTEVLVIYGLGGSGKTQFCLKYVEDNKHRYVIHDPNCIPLTFSFSIVRYWGAFWVDASSEENIESGFASIGAQVGRGATMAAALHWLSHCQQPWLLVLDNADDLDMDLSPCYPSESNGHVIITTRNPNAIEHATVGHLRFRGMEPHEAIDLLLKAAYPDAQQHSQHASPQKWHLAEEISVELGYLPLALAHAAATVRRNIYTLERYLKYYLCQRKSTLSHSRLRSVDEINIIATWEIPFRKIAGRETIEHRDAVDLMHTFAFMHHETIPERIFQRSWESLKVSAHPRRTYPDILQPVWNEGVQARFRRAIGVLCDHSIIEYEPSQGSCTMHPVIHNWARDRLSNPEQKHWLQCTMSILAQCISTHMEASGRRFRAQLLPHVNSCLQFHRSSSAAETGTLEIAAEMERFAWVYTEQSQWKVARHLQESVIRVRIKLLGKRHEDTIRAQRSLGNTLWNLFEIKAAIEVQKKTLDTLRWYRPCLAEWAIWPIWKPVHVPYCLALNDITLTLWLAGERKISRMTGERAVDGLRRRLGSEDPLTLNAMFNLARTYFHLGEEGKSHELLVWVLRLQKRFFGMNHPETLMTRNELGMLLCASKRHLTAAKRLVENVLQARKDILGEEHAYTLWSVNDLSKIHVEMGRPNEAATMLENIIPTVKRTLGDDHVGMTMTKSNLGKAYFIAERWKEAEAIVRPLLAKIPPSHPDWTHNLYGYAHIKFKLGYTDESESYCVDIIDQATRQKGLSLQDPRIVATADLLLRIYDVQGKKDKLSAIRARFPGAGTMKSEDRFDPYTVRRVSKQSPYPPKAVMPARTPRPDSSSRMEQERPSTRLVARRTF
jgi:tetratricopeptide (TPR) repeat protein